MTPNLSLPIKSLVLLCDTFPSLLFDNNKACLGITNGYGLGNKLYLKVAKVNTNLQAYEN